MGYTTDFEGQLKFDKPLSPEQVAYIQTWQNKRRMKRNAVKCVAMPDPTRLAVGLPVGEDGEFFAGGTGFSGQDCDSSVLDSNNPPKTQPGLWCKWTVTNDGTALQWDEREKFYGYIEWLHYMINNFFAPWGVALSGEIEWQGEDRDDVGKIVVVNNQVTILKGKVVYEVATE